MIDTPGITEELPSYQPVNFADISTGLNPGNALDAYQERLFSYSEPLSDTALTEHLLADIILSLQSGGRGLPEGAEDALFLRAKDRLADEYEDTFNKEDARLATQGWIIPTGAHVAALADITARRNRALEQVSHEAMIENARLVLQDRNNARDIAVRFEGVYREYLSGYYARALEAEAETDAAYRVLDGFKASVEAYKAHAEAVESQNRVQTSIAEIGIKKNEASLMAFRGMVDAFSARLQAIGEKNRTEGTRIGAEAQVFGARASAHAEIQSAMASAQKSRVEALQSVAQYTSTLSAGLYAAINVGASVSNGLNVSRSTDHSYRVSLSNSLSESLGGDS